jgi:predicted phage terminase large subunit-like protein
MTRWHEDDLAGRILASEDAPNWHVVNLPALAEENDALGRAPGQALWPSRFDEDDLARIRMVLGTPSFAALYQQRPTPPEGGMFKRQWLEVVGVAPRNCQRVRYWDKAGTSGNGAYSCGVLMAKDGNEQFYIEDVVRGQWSALERESIIRQTAEIDSTRFSGVTTWHEQEPGSGGKESAQATTRNLAGFVVRSETVTGDKETRAMPFAAQCEALNVKLVKAEWNAAYLDELAGFPYGKYKDQVDASSGAFNKLAIGQRQRSRSREY